MYRSICFTTAKVRESEEQPQDHLVKYLVTDCNSIQRRQVYNLRILTSRVYCNVGYPVKCWLPIFSFFRLHYLFIIFVFRQTSFCISVLLSSFFFSLFMSLLVVSFSPSFFFSCVYFMFFLVVFRDNNCENLC